MSGNGEKRTNSGMGAMLTPEGEELLRRGEETPWAVYPRPHMRRDSFFCLNGQWDFAVSREEEAPPSYGEKILLPFVPQSVLSGIGRRLEPDAVLHYRRRFDLPDALRGGRVLLHFGGADQRITVRLNGTEFARSLYAPGAVCFDVTEAIAKENTLLVTVTDRLDGILPYGKQREKRGGMWYTPVSGLTGSVWMERVPEGYISSLSVDSYADRAEFFVVCGDGRPADGRVTVHTPEGDRDFLLEKGRATLTVEGGECWSPEHPRLYPVTVRVGEDSVESYFALRSVESRVIDGIPRLCLNGSPYFFNGLLDQGYFSDGICLPATAEGYEGDILAAKALGFNTLRKHIKLEPEVFYYACDRLGMVVFQDMINNGTYSFLRDTALPTVGLRRRDDRRMHRNAESRRAFLEGMALTVSQVRFHPSVVLYTVFNEGWGQFDHASAYRELKRLDPTRLVDSVSGWFLPPKGRELHSDVESLHVYFKPFSMKKAGRYRKPVILSEFGGYAYKAEGHCFSPEREYGYRSFKSREALREAVDALYVEQILPAIEQGLCGAIYTQLSDVEDEVNGLLTYDRRLWKLREEDKGAWRLPAEKNVRK